MEEEAELAGQTELLLAQVILHQTANGLQEIQNLDKGKQHNLNRNEGAWRGAEEENLLPASHLDHTVAVGVGDVRLQAGEQSSVVMFEVKVLQTQFGVFNSDLHTHTHQHGSDVPLKNKQQSPTGTDLPVLLRNHVEVGLFVPSDGGLRNLVVVVIVQLHVFDFIWNLNATHTETTETNFVRRCTLSGPCCT